MRSLVSEIDGSRDELKDVGVVIVETAGDAQEFDEAREHVSHLLPPAVHG